MFKFFKIGRDEERKIGREEGRLGGGKRRDKKTGRLEETSKKGKEN